MDRKEVNKIIDGERDYQNYHNPEWNNAGKPPVEAEILMMDEYLNKAKTSWTNKCGDPIAGLSEMRSIVALGIRCFENHSVPKHGSQTWDDVPMDREDVYDIIDGEREFQMSLNDKFAHKGLLTIPAELMLMKEYLHMASSKWTASSYTPNGNVAPSLECLRVVVSMGFRCFENYGVPERVMPEVNEQK